MSRYFIEVSYRGTNYSGFQKQQNANSIQAEVEKALKIFFKENVSLTGASRTDAGVHALQNFFHFDHIQGLVICPKWRDLEKALYNLNAILPPDIVIKGIYQVQDNYHCRFDAVEREYKYFIYKKKDPFLKDRAYYFPFTIDLEKLNEAAGILTSFTDFSSFSKRNTQVKNFICNIIKSEWIARDNLIIYNVIANRFLRGMVKGLVGTMLRVATNKITLEEFKKIIVSKNSFKADFTPPSHALFLIAVKYKIDYI